MQARGVWKGGYETQLDDGRGHSVTVDASTENGGTDHGTSAHELLLLSLTGCISTIFHVIAEKRQLRFEKLTVSLQAEKSPAGSTIRRVYGTVTVQTNAPRDEVDTVLRLTVKSCPVGSLFDRAHIPVEVTAKVVPL